MHEIEVHLPVVEVVNADLSVIVRSDGEVHGELRISKGSIDWRPGRHPTAISIGWEDFDRMVQHWDEGRVP